MRLFQLPFKRPSVTQSSGAWWRMMTKEARIEARRIVHISSWNLTWQIVAFPSPRGSRLEHHFYFYPQSTRLVLHMSHPTSQTSYGRLKQLVAAARFSHKPKRVSCRILVSPPKPPPPPSPRFSLLRFQSPVDSCLWHSTSACCMELRGSSRTSKLHYYGHDYGDQAGL